MYNTFMVPLDGSELAECVLPHVEAFGGDPLYRAKSGIVMAEMIQFCRIVSG